LRIYVNVQKHNLVKNLSVCVLSVNNNVSTFELMVINIFAG
jgi:hypothetical protein